MRVPGILGSFEKSFPDKIFAVSIIPNDAFPGIAEDGSLVKGRVGDENQPLLMSGSQQLPGRPVVQFDFLMPGEPAAAEVTDAARNLGTMAAFQTNEYLGNQGAGCSEPVTDSVPCTASTYLAMLNLGIYPLGQNTRYDRSTSKYFTRTRVHSRPTSWPGIWNFCHQPFPW